METTLFVLSHFTLINKILQHWRVGGLVVPRLTAQYSFTWSAWVQARPAPHLEGGWSSGAAPNSAIQLHVVGLGSNPPRPSLNWGRHSAVDGVVPPHPIGLGSNPAVRTAPHSAISFRVASPIVSKK